MRLRNTQEPFDEIEELHPDTIARLLNHKYVEVKADDKPAKRGAFGKKGEQPPADLAELVDDISDEVSGA